MNESEMDNRGSKSKLDARSRCMRHIYIFTNDRCSYICNFVKEQRVDGSWPVKGGMGYLPSFNLTGLRCTLMDFERNYQIRNLSKVLYKKQVRAFSTSQPGIKGFYFNPWFLTGFIDGEGCFRISLTRIKGARAWRVQLFFQINLHVKDRALLEEIRNYLGVGKIHISGKNIFQYRIQTSRELAILINHLDNYPLLSKKKVDYLLFRQAYGLIVKKEHLSKQGISKIVSIKASTT